jgi:hypothetical protein
MKTLAFAWVMVPICLLGINQAAEAQLTAVNSQLVGSTRVNLTQYDYVYSVTATSGGQAYTGVSTVLTSASPNTIVMAGYIMFPDVPANGSVTSTNTYTVRQDRRFAFNPADLTFAFSAAGIPQADAGPNQLVAPGSTVKLDGSASTDPSSLPLSWNWSFVSRPAGSTATLSSANAPQPTFVADIAGNYVLRLIVSDASGASLPQTVLVSTATVPPVANAGPNQTVTTPKMVHLDGSGSTDVPGHPLTYAWTLLSKPAGSTATLSNATAVKPSFNADITGNYLAQLIVNDGTLPSAASVVTISTANTAPVANAGLDLKVNPGATVQLNGSGSTDVNGDALSYVWSILAAPSGSTATLSNSTSVLPTFVADLAGTYVVQLRASDGTVSSFNTVVVSTCTCVAPVSNAGAQRTTHVSSTATLDGTGSSDASGLALSYQWALLARPTGSAASFGATTTSASPQFTPDVAGDYVAQLIVSDGTYSGGPSTVVISTTNSRPISNAGSPQNLSTGAGTVVQLSSTAFDPDGSTITYRWALVSKPSGSFAALTDATTASPTFTADQTGTYVAQLIVNDGTSDSSPSTVLITVSNPPVSITISSLPSTLAFTVTGSGCSPGSYVTGTPSSTLTWISGSPCTVAFTSPQTGGTGMQFVFGNWSDGNSSNPRTITAPASTTTYTANMVTQYLLSTVANPSAGGSVSPASGYYAGGTPVSASASTGYLFTGFAGALNGITTPQNAALSALSSVIANFGTQAVTGCSVFPANNIWNTRIDSLPVDANSDAYISTIGPTKGLHPDFDAVGDGIPFLEVPGTQPPVAVNFGNPDESDAGPYPIPADAPVESGDQHIIVLNNATCVLYEMFASSIQGDGSWTAYSGAVFDLTSNQLRPAWWTSADAAGLPILPGLVRYDEFAAGQINHALRMTVPQTQDAFIWPARHRASSLTGSQYPPMGQRFRLKASFDISGFPPAAQVILTTLKEYGAIVADNGSAWYLTGAPDSRWDDDAMHTLTRVLGSYMEAIDESSLMIDSDSGQALQPATGSQH